MWYGVVAYTMWGLFPLYWKALQHVSSEEILAHRMIWAAVFLVLILWARRRIASLKSFPRKHIFALVLSSGLIGLNWFTYIWGVNHGYVVECSLGYFLNPLVNVLLGVTFLGERLNQLQRTAVLFATVGVGLRAWELGSLPLISLILAFSFSFYALIRKRLGVEALEGLTFETIVLSPCAISYLIWMQTQSQLQFAVSLPTASLLIGAGIVTALPLLCFGVAAQRVSMVTLGMLQYIAPTLQFLLGVLVYGEQIRGREWYGLGCIWMALGIFVVDVTLKRKRSSGVKVSIEKPEHDSV